LTVIVLKFIKGTDFVTKAML